jgi:5-methylcytosine-specific restriction endonuclease McrA
MKLTYYSIAKKARKTGRAPAPAIIYFPIEEVIYALRNSHNYSDACFMLGLSTKKPARSPALRHLYGILDHHDINPDRYLTKNGRTHTPDNKNSKTPSLDELAREVLTLNGTPKKGGNIKKWLWFYGMKEKKCEECGVEMEYNGKPLMLELHHENGNPKDNRIENLRILCPNCHSQTPTYKSKKR